MLFLAPPLCENTYSWGFLLLLYYSIKLARYKVGICISKEDARSRSHLLERFYICQPHKRLQLNDIYLPSLLWFIIYTTLSLHIYISLKYNKKEWGNICNIWICWEQAIAKTLIVSDIIWYETGKDRWDSIKVAVVCIRSKYKLDYKPCDLL